jgi:cutinase
MSTPAFIMMQSCMNARAVLLTDWQGTVVGPPVANNLKDAFPGRVAVQGVDYAAALSTNFLPGGADPAGIREMASILGDAMTQCPDSVIVTGGYS